MRETDAATSARIHEREPDVIAVPFYDGYMNDQPDIPPDKTNSNDNITMSASILRDFWDAVHLGVTTAGAPHVIDAWIDGNSLAVIYESPWWKGQRLGFRRAWPPHYFNNDPSTTGIGIWTELTEPLGETATHLRTDTNGVGWWGDLTP